MFWQVCKWRRGVIKLSGWMVSEDLIDRLSGSRMKFEKNTCSKEILVDCLKLSLSNNQCTNLSVPKISLVSLKTSCAKCCLRPSDDWSFALEVTVDDAVGFDGRRRYLSGLKSLNLPLWWWWHRYATPPRKGALLIWPSQHFRNFLPLLVRTWNWLKLNPRSLPYLAWFLWPPRV